MYAHHSFLFLSIGFILTSIQKKALYTKTLTVQPIQQATLITTTSNDYYNNEQFLKQTTITITNNSNYYNM